MQLFISHASADDALVRTLQRALDLNGLQTWIDSRELVGGDPLWPEIAQRIRTVDAYAVLVSPAALQSAWVGKELKLALQVQRERGAEAYPVIPLSLDGTKLGVLESFFDDTPAYIPVSSAPNGLTEAMPDILAALGLQLRADVEPPIQAETKPLEDLALELSDLSFQVDDKHVRRAQARARLAVRRRLICCAPRPTPPIFARRLSRWRSVAAYRDMS